MKQNNVQVKSTKANVTVKNAEVSVQYPQVSGLASKEAEAAINKVLKDEVDTAVAAFKSKHPNSAEQPRIVHMRSKRRMW